VSANREHIVLVDKQNGDGSSQSGYLSHAIAMGYWLTDAIGNWGVNPESWYWWESGYGRLFEEARSRGSLPGLKSCLSHPEALLGDPPRHGRRCHRILMGT